MLVAAGECNLSCEGLVVGPSQNNTLHPAYCFGQQLSGTTKIEADKIAIAELGSGERPTPPASKLAIRIFQLETGDIDPGQIGSFDMRYFHPG